VVRFVFHFTIIKKLFMKKVAFALLASFFVIVVSCGKKADHDHSDGSHSHADGSTHANHADSVKQEEFKADSTSHHHDSTDHKHPHN
jgi:hypothetical protein